MDFLRGWSIMDITFGAYCTVLSGAYFILIPLLNTLTLCVTKRAAGGSDVGVGGGSLTAPSSTNGFI